MADRESTEYSRLVGAVIRGKYKKLGLTLQQLSEMTGIPYATLRRRVAGEGDIKIHELGVIAPAVGSTATAILDEALADYGGLEKLIADVRADVLHGEVSEAPTTTDDVEEMRRRRQAKAAAMTPEELEAQRHAATNDPELDMDEPETP